MDYSNSQPQTHKDAGKFEELVGIKDTSADITTVSMKGGGLTAEHSGGLGPRQPHTGSMTSWRYFPGESSCV